MKRRDLLKLGGLTLVQTGALQFPSLGQLRHPDTTGGASGKADYTLHISPVTVELDRSHIISTIGYNGTAPGPVLRMREGKTVTIEVINDTDTPELVHWHGMLIPAEVDGTEEEGSPLIPPHGRYRFQLTPGPAGSRWYHSHAMAMENLHKGAFTGQFGFVYVEGANEPGRYDQELFLALRDWEPFFTSTMEDDDDDTHNDPILEKPATINTDPNGLEVGSMTYSINDKALGSGEPIRVREGQRLLIHLLNASAIENRRIAFSGHKMTVVALDGNPVPKPQSIDSLFLGAGERADVVVEMTRPGIWILGSTEKMVREAGLGVVVEYAGQHRQPQWIDPPRWSWDYTIFGNSVSSLPVPQKRLRQSLKKFRAALVSSTRGWSMVSHIPMMENLCWKRE